MRKNSNAHKHLWSRGEDNGLLPDGRYIYVPVGGHPIILTPGEDGVTEEDVLILSSMDYEEAKKKDYERKKRDHWFECEKQDAESPNSDTSVDPVEQLPDPHSDVFTALFPEEEPQNIRLSLLHQFIDRLQPQQIDLLYALYGELRQMTEIAKQQGVTKYAIYNREKKIIKKLKKMFAESGIE